MDCGNLHANHFASNSGEPSISHGLGRNQGLPECCNLVGDRWFPSLAVIDMEAKIASILPMSGPDRCRPGNWCPKRRFHPWLRIPLRQVRLQSRCVHLRRPGRQREDMARYQGQADSADVPSRQADNKGCCHQCDRLHVFAPCVNMIQMPPAFVASELN